MSSQTTKKEKRTYTVEVEIEWDIKPFLRTETDARDAAILMADNLVMERLRGSSSTAGFSQAKVIGVSYEN
jgi:hypothetical protein